MSDHTDRSREALKDAITMAGSPAALASALEEHGVTISRQGIEHWRDNAVDGVPPRAALVIYELYGIPLYRLRADIWPPTVVHEGKVPRKVRRPS